MSSLAPIYDAHREFLHTNLTDALANNGAYLGGFCVETNGGPRSTTSATARNLIDDTGTLYLKT